MAHDNLPPCARMARLNQVRLRFLNHLSFTHVLVEALMGTGGLAVMTVGALLVTGGSLDASVLPLLTLLALASFIPVAEIAHWQRAGGYPGLGAAYFCR